MSVYIKVNNAWNEISGTEQPYVKVSGEWKSVSQMYVKVSGAWKQVYEYDNTGPTVPAPTVTATSGTLDTVYWGSILDSGSGIASATIYQTYTGSESGTVTGTSQTITDFTNGLTTFAIPTTTTSTNRRNTPTGETWQVKYRIVAVDNAGNTTTGSYSANHYTKPKGDYIVASNAADARNIGNTAWLAQDSTDEGVVGVSTTKAYGAWFYGNNAFSNVCRGWAPNSGTIFIQRPGSSQPNRGNSGTFTIKGHQSETKSGALTYSGTAITEYISGDDGTGNPALHSTMLTNLGTDTIKGFALTDHSTGIGFLRGLTRSTNNNSFNIYSGTVFLTFT